MQIGKALGVVRRAGRRPEQSLRLAKGGARRLGRRPGPRLHFPSFKRAFTKKFVEYHRIGLTLNYLPITRTTLEYVEAKRLANSMVGATQVKKAKAGYMWPWLVRTHLIAMMRVNGVEALTVSKDPLDDESFALLAAPDQSGWVTAWGQEFGGNIKQMCRELRYSGPPELLSMLACVIGDSGLERYAEEDINAHASDISATRDSHRQMWGWEGNPAVLVRAILHDGVGEGGA